MPDQIQLRGGDETENDAFTGAAREVTVDTTNKTLRIHDGTTAGGHPLIQGTASTAADTDTIALRDAWGRLQVADPQNDSDVVNKGFMDTAIAGSLLAATSDAVAARETTSSNAFTDLTTLGPSVTVTIPASGKALVILTAGITNSSTPYGGAMSFDGAGVTAALVDSLTLWPTIANDQVIASTVLHLDGLSTGEQTFTAKYRRRGGGTADFGDRRITVIPLP
ncbi:MAG: hypothetical protein WD061_00020 [Candidatus Saccharimonadales bacterium]